MRGGQGRHCLEKRSGTAPPTAPPMEANIFIRGAMKRPFRASVILTSAIGIRHRLIPFPTARVFGVHDMLGNGWEWTSTVFAPFPRFEPFPFYPGYSADFFDGKHFVMKGGSPRTAACMLRPTFRNWFQAHYQYVYAGFRCVNHSSKE